MEQYEVNLLLFLRYTYFMENKVFQERLKKLRKERNLSQDEVGIPLNISGRTVGNYESGEREPALDTLIKIADFYGVSADYLLGRTESRGVDSVNEEVSMLENLPDKARDEVRVLMEYIRYKYL
jgi:transcriptional regulator with XRE-family HTH domain